MKKLLILGIFIVVCLSFSASVYGQSESAQRNALVGAWKLVELDRPSADGLIHAVPSTGMFVFTNDGHVEVQVMELDPKPQSGPEQYSSGGYEASFGSYTVDESAHTFTYHVQGAVAHNLIGKDLLRAYEINGNRLIVKSVRADEHWRVVWEHYESALYH